MTPRKSFCCVLLRDYPPEDLEAGDGVFGQCLPCGRVVLSEYLEKDGGSLGAIFEENARLGFHCTVDQSVEHELGTLPVFERVHGKQGVFVRVNA